MWGMGPKEFKAQFDAIKSAKKIKVLLNSPGGSVFDGITIYNLIAAEREKVEIEVLGLAASVASIIAMAGNRLTIAKGAYLMIHNPWTIAVGGSGDLRKTADILDKMKGEFVAIYKKKSGLEDDEITALMDAETWMTSEEAVANGFADDEEDYGQVAAKASAFSLGKYAFAHVPDPLAKNTDSKKVSNPRELETLLRDSGMSRSEAVAIVANGWKALNQGEPEPEPQSESAKKLTISPAMLIDEMDANA
jgi:ATP-dependent Clp protease protease subunit